jgi:hypothetical protein
MSEKTFGDTESTGAGMSKTDGTYVCRECPQVLAAEAVAKFLRYILSGYGVCPRCGKEVFRMIPSFRDQDPFPFCCEDHKFWGYGSPRRG